MLAKLDPTDDPSCSRRLDFRSWKKVFQSSMSFDFGDEDSVVVGCPDVFRESVAVLAGEGKVEARLTSCLEGVLNGEVVLIVLLVL